MSRFAGEWRPGHYLLLWQRDLRCKFILGNVYTRAGRRERETLFLYFSLCTGTCWLVKKPSTECCHDVGSTLLSTISLFAAAFIGTKRSRNFSKLAWCTALQLSCCCHFCFKITALTVKHLSRRENNYLFKRWHPVTESCWKSLSSFYCNVCHWMIAWLCSILCTF